MPSRKSSPRTSSTTTPRPRLPSPSSSTPLGSTTAPTESRDSSTSSTQSWLSPTSTLSLVKSSLSTRDSLRPLPPSTTPGCSPATSKTGRPSVADGSQSVASALGATRGSSPPASALAPRSTHGSTTWRGNQTADPKLKNVSVGLLACVFACLLREKDTPYIPSKICSS